MDENGRIISILFAALLAWQCGGSFSEDSPLVAEHNGASLPERLVAAIRDRDGRAVKKYLDQGADPNSRNSFGDTALIWAIERRSHELAAELLHLGADPNLAGTYGRTALHWACAAAEPELVKLLVEQGAKIDRKDQGKFTGLMRSAAANDEVSLRSLLDRGADPHLLNLSGRSALALAVEKGAVDVIEPLVLAGSDLNSVREDGHTLLREIVEMEFERFLLTDAVLQMYPGLRGRVQGMYREVVKNLDERPCWDLRSIEKRVHTLTNQERVARGLRPLEYDDSLAAIALAHSTDMARAHFFSHENPAREGPTQRAHKAGYPVRRDLGGGQIRTGIGENIFQGHRVAGFSAYVERGVRHVENRYLTGEDLARACVEGWMKSPGHRANILTAEYLREGFGIAVAEDQKVYITQNFY